MEISESGISFHTDGAGEPDHEQDADHVAFLQAPAAPTQAPTSFHYFQSDVVPQVGDRIATGSFGECKIISITKAWELECRNIMTGEIGHSFADDCDLIDRPAAPCPSASLLPLVPPVGVTGAKLYYEGNTARPGYPCKNCFHRLEEHADGYICPVPAPVSPSLPATGEDEALDLLLEGMAKLDLARKVKSLKADVERLTGALRDTLQAAETLWKIANNRKDIPQNDTFDAARSALSLAEVGKH
jgi:hypothetical protein